MEKVPVELVQTIAQEVSYCVLVYQPLLRMTSCNQVILSVYLRYRSRHRIFVPLIWQRCTIPVDEHMKIQEVSSSRTCFTESGSKDTFESLKLVKHLRLDAPIRRKQLLRCYGAVYTIREFESQARKKIRVPTVIQVPRMIQVQMMPQKPTPAQSITLS
jgi:hypothetical protein